MVHLDPFYDVAVVVRNATMIPQDSLVRNTHAVLCVQTSIREV